MDERGARGAVFEMITHDPKKLFILLNKGHLDKAQIITNPIVKVKLASERDTHNLEVGGDKTIIHYSKWKEQRHKQEKIDKRMRQLNKQIKREAHRRTGDVFPVLNHDESGRLQK